MFKSLVSKAWTEGEKNPYRVRCVKSDASHRPRVILHVLLFVVIASMWGVSIILATTPNNELYERGMENAIALDLCIGTPAALSIAIVSFRARKTSPSIALFALTQLLAWGHSVGIFLVLLLSLIAFSR